MKKEDLIKELQKLPDGIEVCVFHSSLNAAQSDGDEAGCGYGIYNKFVVYEMDKKSKADDSKPFAVIDFIEDEYLLGEQ